MQDNKYIIRLSRKAKPNFIADANSDFQASTINGFGKKIKSEKDFLFLLSQKNKKSHPATGPIFIRGIKKGTMLAVKIKKIKLISNYYQCVSFSTGLFPKYGNSRNTKIFDCKEYIDFDKIKLKVTPSIGFIATTPAFEIGCGRAGAYGGNLDMSQITEGSIVHLPVYNDGALLAVGDVHALLGEAEISGTGAEADAEITMNFSSRDSFFPFPIIEKEKEIMILGHGRSIKEALKKAAFNTLNYLKRISTFKPSNIYLILGLTAKVIIGNSTSHTKTVAVCLNKEVWKIK